VSRWFICGLASKHAKSTTLELTSNHLLLFDFEAESKQAKVSLVGALAKSRVNHL
jgi:hypothetical protein